MPDRRVQIDILADEKGFTRGTGNATQSASKLENALKKLGPVGNALQGVLNKLGLSSITTAEGIAGVALAAGGVSAALVKKAIDGYVALADRIRAYAAVTGQSAEQSSRQVQAFHELGVEEDVAAAGMFRLAREAATAPEKLKALGVEVAKDAQGNIDLNATLLNVMGAYQSTSDAGERARIVFAAFGRGGAAMIPILEADRLQLQKLEEQAGKVYSQKDLDNARQYSIEQKKLGDNWGRFVGQLAGGVVPALASFFENTNADTYAMQHLDEALKQGKISHDRYNQAIQDPVHDALLEAWRKEYIAGQNAKAGIDALAQSQRAAAQAAQAEADAENKLYDTIFKSIDASDAYKDAQNKLANDQAKWAQAQNAYADAVRAYGPASDQAKAAALNLHDANQAVDESFRKVAEAAVAYAEEQAAVDGRTLSASQKADIFRGKLEELIATLGPTDPLRKELQAYIDALNSIPADKTTTVHLRTSAEEARRAVGGHGTLEFDSGGVVPGSPGQAVPAIVHGGEVVLNRDQQRALGSAGTKAPIIVNINIDGLYADGPAIDRLANTIAQRLTYATGR